MNAGEAIVDQVQPVLRWAGGKRWLVSHLRTLTQGIDVGAYHEPFLGGASVFLGLNPKRAFLADLNAELIETYECIRQKPREISDRLQEYENTAESYYGARDEKPDDAVGRAARFIFLNHHSFNGIYRVNLQGVYNVPFGRRARPNMPGEDELVAFSRRLEAASLSSGDFFETLENVKAGDLVFVDPPYTVAHNNNGFVKYNQKLFSFEDQHRLSEYLDGVRDLGAHYIMTNAAHESIALLFEKGDRRIETSRRNSVGGATSARGSATEYLFTNIRSDG
ncbi:DNA adenine methylase [Terrabacter sp. GCM10028922]|uniref:DNA adenine methylase n=1 Tax=Terrabacter sp. GCM10028922 TaxID=3273428 RepID=UPI003615FE27